MRPRFPALLVVSWLVACGDGVAPTTPTPQPSSCSASTDQVPFIPGQTVPSPAQATACQANARPRIENVVTLKRDGGLQVDYSFVDPDGETVCGFVFMNRPAGGGCGIAGSVFDNSVSFPVAVRIVAWDSRGCLAEPVCRTVP